VEQLTSRDQLVHHFLQADILLEQIFARLQSADFSLNQQGDVQQRRIVDHPFALKLRKHFRRIAARGKIDNLVGAQRP